MKLRVIVLAAALAACGQSGEAGKAGAPAAPNPFDLSIEVGRYDVMLGQVQDLTSDRPSVSEPEVTDPHDLARRLRETVWRYNLERSELCARGLFAEVACGPAYQPVWIGESADAAPSIEELQTRSNAVGDEVQRFWSAVCDDARARETDEQARMYVCAIE